MTVSLPLQHQRKLHLIVPPPHVGMDLVADLPGNLSGYKQILVLACCISKYVTVCPLSTKTTKSDLDASSKI